MPHFFKKSSNWIKADRERKSWTGDAYGSPYPDSFNLHNALTIIDTALELYTLGMAKSWCIKHYHTIFPYLVARLGDKTKVGLINTADLIIWDRIGTGELTFYGHGGGMQEDIFTIAGRASWILNQLTGENFAIVHADLTQEQSESFKLRWTEYINKLKR